MNLFLLLGIIAASLANTLADSVAECGQWAEQGECTINPNYMGEHCADACRLQAERDRERTVEIDKKVGHIKAFWELEAEDIDGNVVKFDQFKGQVTIVANVASYCGYTESHYKALNKLYATFQGSKIPLNIIAFPCNQFGEQEPESCPKIKQFAKSKGVEFTMMNKVDVNGPDTHPVYMWLKMIAGPPRIIWNFATYFVIEPTGTVSSFSGVDPMELKIVVQEAMSIDEKVEL